MYDWQSVLWKLPLWFNLFLIGCEYQRLTGGCKTTEENCQRSRQENQTVWGEVICPWIK